MARFDVYSGARGKGYLLDCQADLLSILSTRVVVPLVPASGLPVTPRLNPAFRIEGQDYIMMTQQVFAIPRERLGKPVTSLEDEQGPIMNAIDLLLTGV
ncbi:CcdB family protein [Sphingorhabdus sp.]|uniref:CcdB family protein n=1 Tax=Sphingorhabdus sp. TaxID=1902408 RepID=UPI0032B81D01